MDKIIDFQITLYHILYNAELLLAEVLSVQEPYVYLSNLRQLEYELLTARLDYGDDLEFKKVSKILKYVTNEMKSHTEMTMNKYILLANTNAKACDYEMRYIYLTDKFKKDKHKSDDFYINLLQQELETITPKLGEIRMQLTMRRFCIFIDIVNKKFMI